MKNERKPEALHLAGFREFMGYDPETGIVTWLKKPTKRSPVKPGQQVGSIKGHRYRRVRVDWSGEQRIFAVHRIAWFLHHKTWPEEQIDHINRDKTDNRIQNLRLVTHSLNSHNRTIPKNSTSKRRGVSRASARNR